MGKGFKIPDSGRALVEGEVRGKVPGTISVNRKNLHELCKKLDIHPFERILLISANKKTELGITEDIPIELQLKAAVEACSYLFSQMKSVEATLKIKRSSSAVKALTNHELDTIEVLGEYKNDD